ncbi:MAG TPA: PAS domain S-box protein [Anaerolineae bacterium]|nr:PAS domain S-box protein [Anaerolineae bacterium]HMR64835.1 PAS domain S-box protein [Anaerolineae bacterium]
MDSSKKTGDPSGADRRTLRFDANLLRQQEFSERKLRDELQQSYQRLEIALKNSPIIVYNQDTKLRYTWIYNANPVFNPVAVLGKTDADLLPAEDAERLTRLKRTVLEQGVGVRQEISLDVRGEVRVFDLTIEPLRDLNGSIVGITCAAMDITQQTRATEALQRIQVALEQRVAEIENASDAIISTDLNLIIQSWNKAAEAIYGWSESETVGQSITIIQPGFGAEQRRAVLRQILATGRWRGEVIQRHRHGTELYISTAVSVIRDLSGHPTRFVAVNRDITARKRVEEERTRLFAEIRQQSKKLQALNRRLAEVQEAERKGLARELHDRVGQNLTALDLNLNIIQNRLAEKGEAGDSLIEERLKESLLLIEETGRHIRDVMANLRPPVLDDYGLLAALHWYGQRFGARVKFKVSVEGKDPIPRLPGPVEDTLFRLAQEALTNIAKHARAQNATVTLSTDDSAVRLVIADDGVGFDLARWSDPVRRQSWGLLTMTELAETIGGRCRIESAPGHGTRIIVEVPR